MLGVDDSPASLGIIPCAIDWLFRLIADQKERTGARFSVRVSAVEVTGKHEQLRDLLADTATIGELHKFRPLDVSPVAWTLRPMCGLEAKLFGLGLGLSFGLSLVVSGLGLIEIGLTTLKVVTLLGLLGLKLKS